MTYVSGGIGRSGFGFTTTRAPRWTLVLVRRVGQIEKRHALLDALVLEKLATHVEPGDRVTAQSKLHRVVGRVRLDLAERQRANQLRGCDGFGPRSIARTRGRIPRGP